ncbi:MAG: phage integrase N-terminal SAM-like domain-containing protein, partial [Dehalococcoidales bacterium]|nr:phage integrase N-terminal SAM-like domain-containing protein [Dehalococcoidales bacterium]
MTAIKKASNTGRKGGDNQTKVQIWFRAPKIWSDFLEKKASEECCTTSDLIRHAFILAYGAELKEYRINPEANHEDNHSSYSQMGNLTQILPSSANSQAIVSYIESDPWIESMSAFVANKRSSHTRQAYRLVLNQFLSFVTKHPSDANQSDVIRYRHQLEHLGSAPSSIKQHLSAISGY